MNLKTTFLGIFLLISATAHALDIAVDPPAEVILPYLPNAAQTAPHIGYAFRFRFTGQPIGFVGSNYDIWIDEGLYQNPGEPTMPPIDDGGHVNHNERNRNGAALSLSSNAPFPPAGPRYLRINGFSPAEGITFYYYPPEMSGTYRITVFGGDFHTTIPLIVPVAVKIPSLLEVTAVSGGWNLAGANTRHPSNHWALSTTIDYLTSARSTWLSVIPTAPAWLLNDESLRWGGVFDINATTEWRPPHFTHRTGKSLDISHNPVAPEDRDTLYHLFRGDPIKIAGGAMVQLPKPRFVLYKSPGHGTHYHVELR